MYDKKTLKHKLIRNFFVESPGKHYSGSFIDVDFGCFDYYCNCYCDVCVVCHDRHGIDQGFLVLPVVVLVQGFYWVAVVGDCCSGFWELEVTKRSKFSNWMRHERLWQWILYLRYVAIRASCWSIRGFQSFPFPLRCLRNEMVKL